MILTFENKIPHCSEDAWIAENATVIGDVVLHRNTSIFFQSVIRGDKDSIIIEEGTNIQDLCMLHTDPNHVLHIGKQVSVGHGCILHGCQIEDEVLIGMGAIIMNGAHIGTHCIIGAGSLITEHTHIPDHSVVVGNPGRIIKQVSNEQIDMILDNALHYQKLSKQYKESTYE